MKITVVGSGYVGMSMAALLGQSDEVTILDIDQERVEKINRNISPVNDEDIHFFLKEKKTKIIATLNQEMAFGEADYIIISTPTDYDSDLNFFNTTSVENVITDAINCKTNALIVIKSTVPVGYTESLREKFSYNKIIFVPEFLREGSGLNDNLYPSRIIIGSFLDEAKRFSEILIKNTQKQNVQILFMESAEAEAVKLFSNTFLSN